jgi:1,2-dihydroxy-3-keto-5-methylthiopentene dioxygenase
MQAFWLDGGLPIDAQALRAEGILYERIALGEHEPFLAALMASKGYLARDEVELRPTTENLEAIGAKFAREHHHDEDEVRFVLEGEGIFDIRSRDDRWMRVIVDPGDLLGIPRGRYHRFLLTEQKTIRCVRLFQDPKGWVPYYRDRQPC